MLDRIAVIGSLNVDNVTYTNNPHAPGKTVFGNNFMSNVGGKGANQAIAVKFLGGDAIFFGARGKDSNGDFASKFLSDNGLRFYLKRVDISTGVSNIIINENNGENSIICVPGANLSLVKDDVDFWMPKIKECKILITQLETSIEPVLYALEKAKNEGLITILNPAPFHEFDMKTMRFLDYFIPNEHELNDYVKGDEDVETKAKKLLEFGCKNVIVTLGEKGSVLVNKDGVNYVGAHKVKAIDTTGAGDSYIGAFAKALLDGKDTVEAMKFASYCSSLTVQKRGAIISLPKLEDLNY